MSDIEKIESLGDNHIGTSVDTPMRDDAFVKNDKENRYNSRAFKGIMGPWGSI